MTQETYVEKVKVLELRQKQTGFQHFYQQAKKS